MFQCLSFVSLNKQQQQQQQQQNICCEASTFFVRVYCSAVKRNLARLIQPETSGAKEQRLPAHCATIVSTCVANHVCRVRQQLLQQQPAKRHRTLQLCRDSRDVVPTECRCRDQSLASSFCFPRLTLSNFWLTVRRSFLALCMSVVINSCLQFAFISLRNQKRSFPRKTGRRKLAIDV